MSGTKKLIELLNQIMEDDKIEPRQWLNCPTEEKQTDLDPPPLPRFSRLPR